MDITTIGLDIAKNVFQPHGVDAHGKAVLRKQLKRNQALAFFAHRVPCLIGLEACSGAHYWARGLVKPGHGARLTGPQFVKPYVKGNQNDANDAEATREAVRRPNMRFVPTGHKCRQKASDSKTHKCCSGLVKGRTALANRIRGLLAETALSLP